MLRASVCFTFSRCKVNGLGCQTERHLLLPFPGSFMQGCGGTSPGVDQCAPCSECGPNEYEVLPSMPNTLTISHHTWTISHRKAEHTEQALGCTGSNGNRVCASCESYARNCSFGEHLEECGDGRMGKCIACGKDKSGEWNHKRYLKGCSGLSQGEMVACEDCPGTLRRRGCEFIYPGTCEPCATCPENHFVQGCGGELAGRCVSCKLQHQTCNSYMDVFEKSLPIFWLKDCNGNNPGTCMDCSQCSEDEYDSVS